MEEKLYVVVKPMIGDYLGNDLRLVKEYKNLNEAMNKSIKDIIYETAQPNEDNNSYENQACEWVRSIIDKAVDYKKTHKLKHYDVEVGGISNDENYEEIIIDSIDDKLKKYDIIIKSEIHEDKNEIINYKLITLTFCDLDGGFGEGA